MREKANVFTTKLWKSQINNTRIVLCQKSKHYGCGRMGGSSRTGTAYDGWQRQDMTNTK